jgi:hypothetical protein
MLKFCSEFCCGFELGEGEDCSHLGPGEDYSRLRPGEDCSHLGPGEDCLHVGPGEDPKKSASQSHSNGIIFLISSMTLSKTYLVRVLKGRRGRSSFPYRTRGDC